MIRTLIIIFAIGLIVSSACFGVAASMGHYGFKGDGDWEDGQFVVDGEKGAKFYGPQGTRELNWEGTDFLKVNISGTVRYTQGEPAKITITGPRKLIDNVEVRGGVISFDHDHWGRRGSRGLEINITAPAVANFTFNGSQDVEIDKYAQDVLSIEVNGSGDVTARGAARLTNIDIRGSGSVDASEIVGEEVRVEIMGSGDTTIAPTKAANIEIRGSGDVDLLSNPARLETDVKGSGDINYRAPDEEEAPAKAAASASP